MTQGMLRFRRLHKFFGSKRVAFLEACIIGVVSGLAAVTLKQSVELLTAWRLESTLPAWFLLPVVGLLGGIASGWLLERVSPEAAGSGIPKVKAVLAYVNIPLNLRVALAKLISTILALGSGLSLGRQGPTVQIGAALAAQLSQWVPTSPEYRRQLIAAGAAAGLAAGFNAPIAGVLFVVEELLQDFSNLTLGTAILASFVGAVVSRLLGGQGLNLTSFGMLQTGLSVQDLPFLALLGVLAGIFGGLFSQGIFSSLHLFRQMKRLSLSARIGLAGFCTGLVGVVLPIAAQDNTGLREILVTGGAASWPIIAVVFVAKFGLTLLAYGSGASGGIFAPALVLGSALGCLVSFVAQVSHAWMGLPVATLNSSNTTTYALTGMGAFFSAVTRGPITAIVIVFEMTANFNLVLPLMIGSGLAYLLSDKISSGSIYDRLLTFQGIELNPTPLDANPWANLTAEDLMQRRVETLSATMTVNEALEAFSRSHHRGFPVLSQGKLIGILTQTDLGDTTQSKPPDLLIRDIMTPHPVVVSPESSLTKVLDLLNRLKISRLPVTEGTRLVGIITRGDIIRAESERLSGKMTAVGPATTPSCGIYRTRSPATGHGRLLLPLSDPETAPMLLRMAIAIAQREQYELECLHVILVSRSLSPEEAVVDTVPGKQLLSYAQQLAEAAAVPLHTQIRTAHDVAPTLLEVIKKRHIDQVLLGWKRPSLTPGRVLGNVVDTLLRQAPCPVIVVKPGRTSHFDRWLLPSAGGPNSKLALRLLPSLTQLGHFPQIYLCAIAAKKDNQAQIHRQLTRRGRILERRLQGQINTRLHVSENVAEAIVQLGERYQCDVIMVGASRESLFSHVIKGNIPLEVAQHSEATVILVQHNSINAKPFRLLDSEESTTPITESGTPTQDPL